MYNNNNNNSNNNNINNKNNNNTKSRHHVLIMVSKMRQIQAEKADKTNFKIYIANWLESLPRLVQSVLE